MREFIRRAVVGLAAFFSSHILITSLLFSASWEGKWGLLLSGTCCWYVWFWFCGVRLFTDVEPAYRPLLSAYCEEHLTAERKAGHEIYPARPASQSDEAAGPTCAATSICSQMGDEHGKLAWWKLLYLYMVLFCRKCSVDLDIFVLVFSYATLVYCFKSTL